MAAETGFHFRLSRSQCATERVNCYKKPTAVGLQKQPLHSPAEGFTFA
jgi:hypothetical protein